jgi:competence ComEA-like helix-hairpin-helix protein
MLESLRQIFAFTRAEMIALCVLLSACLIGGAILLYDHSRQTLPAELIFEPIPTSRAATNPVAEAPAVEQPSLATARQQSPAVLRPVQVDINTAPIDSLELVPFIGATLAQRIVDYRARHGRFGSVDDLVKVYGIGPKSLNKLRPYLICR